MLGQLWSWKRRTERTKGVVQIWERSVVQEEEALTINVVIMIFISQHIIIMIDNSIII